MGQNFVDFLFHFHLFVINKYCKNVCNRKEWLQSKIIYKV